MIDLPLPVLVQNAALLLAVAVIFDAASSRVTIERTRVQEWIAGLLLGGVGISIMLTPWQFAPGIFFDTRTVLLSISGLFFGTIPTVAALAVMIAWRLAQGGPAALTGIVGMLVAAGIGLAWRRRRPALEDLSLRDLYLFGLGAHVITLAQVASLLMLTVPQSAAAVLSRFWIPLLVVYPIATALLGVLLVARLRSRRLSAANAKLQQQVEAQLEEVRASRARIVTAGDAERRRIERDLHDGAQQRLVALTLALRLARTRLGDEGDPAVRLGLEQAADEARAALAELRELARGIHPQVLTEAGLHAAVESLAARAPSTVSVDIDPTVRFTPDVEAIAYFVVSESLANVAKHAGATSVEVRADWRDGVLTIEVADDGRGGADIRTGTGLRGLLDRVSAADGSLEVVSPHGSGTRVVARIPAPAPTHLTTPATAPLATRATRPRESGIALLAADRSRSIIEP